MKTTHTVTAAVLLSLGLACAAIALNAGNFAAPVAETIPTVVITGSRLVPEEAIPTVTITAKRLTAAEKSLMAEQDNAAAAQRLATDGRLKKIAGGRG